MADPHPLFDVEIHLCKILQFYDNFYTKKEMGIKLIHQNIQNWKRSVNAFEKMKSSNLWNLKLSMWNKAVRQIPIQQYVHMKLLEWAIEFEIVSRSLQNRLCS